LIYADPAQGAVVPIYFYITLPFKAKGIIRTICDTLETTDAMVGNAHDFRMGIHGFRVLAPFTAQGTPLKEDKCTNASPVMYGKTLNIENKPGQVGLVFVLKVKGVLTFFPGHSLCPLLKTDRFPKEIGPYKTMVRIADEIR
jgi:hypothetical protein